MTDDDIFTNASVVRLPWKVSGKEKEKERWLFKVRYLKECDRERSMIYKSDHSLIKLHLKRVTIIK